MSFLCVFVSASPTGTKAGSSRSFMDQDLYRPQLPHNNLTNVVELLIKRASGSESTNYFNNQLGEPIISHRDFKKSIKGKYSTFWFEVSLKLIIKGTFVIQHIKYCKSLYPSLSFKICFGSFRFRMIPSHHGQGTRS